MSKASPLDSGPREQRYLAQTGRNELTPAQRRRLRHKENALQAALARGAR